MGTPPTAGAKGSCRSPRRSPATTTRKRSCSRTTRRSRWCWTRCGPRRRL